MGKMRNNAGIWNAIWSDMFIDTTFMRKKGIIRITMKPATLKTWSPAYMYQIGGRYLLIRFLTTEDAEIIQDIYKEERLGRITADRKDRMAIRDTLHECINPPDPDDYPKKIVKEGIC